MPVHLGDARIAVLRGFRIRADTNPTELYETPDIIFQFAFTPNVLQIGILLSEREVECRLN